MSFPLAPPAISDARAACLLTSDDTIFQRLRHSPGCAGLNTAEELLLGAQPADEVVVENAAGAVGAFKASIHLVHFQKRMRVSRKVSVEFIARGTWAQPKCLPQFSRAKKLTRSAAPQVEYGHFRSKSRALRTGTVYDPVHG